MHSPGYGSRHPELITLLDTLTPVAVTRISWIGLTDLDVAAYRDWPECPDFLVTSVRCIVRVDDRVVVCHTPDGPHIVPGGRREPGESHTATAVREVREETGWLLDEPDLSFVGFFHYRMLDPLPEDHPFPHPDILQLVYTARAARHSADWSSWSDSEGWEQRHDLVPTADLANLPIPTYQLSLLPT